jgi:hypothetical protein
MKIAMRSGALNQLYEPLESLHEAVAKMAEDALMSGQGNSGGCGLAFHLVPNIRSVLALLVKS